MPSAETPIEETLKGPIPTAVTLRDVDAVPGVEIAGVVPGEGLWAAEAGVNAPEVRVVGMTIAGGVDVDPLEDREPRRT